MHIRHNKADRVSVTFFSLLLLSFLQVHKVIKNPHFEDIIRIYVWKNLFYVYLEFRNNDNPYRRFAMWYQQLN